MVKETFGENKFFVFKNNENFFTSIWDFETVLTAKIEKNTVFTTDYRNFIVSHFFQVVETNRISKAED